MVSLVVLGAGLGFAGFTPQGRDVTELIRGFGPAVIEAQRNPDLLFQNVGHNHVNILLIGQDRNWKVGKVFDPTMGKMRSYQVEDTDTPAQRHHDHRFAR